MRYTVITIITFFALAVSANAQHSFHTGEISFTKDRQPQTLISGKSTFGFFGNWNYGVTDIHGDAAYITSRRLALAINIDRLNTLNVGLGSYNVRSDIEPVSWSHLTIPEPKILVEYSGFELEYLHRPNDLIHFGAMVLIGSGDARYENRNIPVQTTKDAFFVVKPGLTLNLNITRWLKMTTAAHYRFVQNVNLEGTSDADLSGFHASLGFRVGIF